MDVISKFENKMLCLEEDFFIDTKDDRKPHKDCYVYYRYDYYRKNFHKKLLCDNLMENPFVCSRKLQDITTKPTLQDSTTASSWIPVVASLFGILLIATICAIIFKKRNSRHLNGIIEEKNFQLQPLSPSTSKQVCV